MFTRITCLNNKSLSARFESLFRQYLHEVRNQAQQTDLKHVRTAVRNAIDFLQRIAIQ